MPFVGLEYGTWGLFKYSILFKDNFYSRKNNLEL